MRRFSTTLAQIIVLCGFASAQAAPWHDDLADAMAGTWRADGEVMGKTAHHIVEADWILNHQFLRLHETTAPDAPAVEKRYEALWFLGYDPISERYVLHLMDVFGARFSETLGYGIRSGNEIRFVFEYPDGPFHTTWIVGKSSSQWRMEQKDKDGKWSSFADLKISPVEKH
jgi:hypothetical protein